MEIPLSAILACIAALAGAIATLWKLDRNRLKESLRIAQEIIATREQRINELQDQLLREVRNNGNET